MVLRPPAPQARAMTAQLFDLTARRRDGRRRRGPAAAAPVRHVPDAFVAALLCVAVDELRDEPARVLQLAR
jgi:hypothetical protein